MWPTSKVSPSGAARATAVEPMAPPAPGRLSTMTVRPSAGAELVGDDAREDVGGAARGERRDDGDGAGGIGRGGLRTGRCAARRQGGERGSGGGKSGEREKFAAAHGVSPDGVRSFGESVARMRWEGSGGGSRLTGLPCAYRLEETRCASILLDRLQARRHLDGGRRLVERRVTPSPRNYPPPASRRPCRTGW